jgi:hypothetical protein
LESVYAGNRIEGSNPSPSAIFALARCATQIFAPLRQNWLTHFV